MHLTIAFWAESVHAIVTEDLAMRKMCANLVPKVLYHDMMVACEIWGDVTLSTPPQTRLHLTFSCLKHLQGYQFESTKAIQAAMIKALTSIP